MARALRQKAMASAGAAASRMSGAEVDTIQGALKLGSLFCPECGFQPGLFFSGQPLGLCGGVNEDKQHNRCQYQGGGAFEDEDRDHDESDSDSDSDRSGSNSGQG